MLTRREFLGLVGGGTAVSLLPAACRRAEPGVLVNDVHSGLNPTRVSRDVVIDSPDTLRAAIKAARAEGKAISIAGGRHAMGGQQFGAGTVLLDTRGMKRVLALDAERGIVHAEAGIQWPELVDALLALQQDRPKQWGIVQKQTGADRLTLGGALGANIHGRGLKFQPFIQDIEAFTLMDAEGELRRCSRREHSELFRLAIGGYGLFGVVTSVELRLMPRTKLERVVELIDVNDLMPAVERRIAAGYLYGDCQFSTDVPSEGFMRQGVFSCYRPLPTDTPMPAVHKELSEQNWRDLYYLAHADTKRTYDMYSSYYLSTHGQKYWSDTHQLSVYVDDYHREVDRRLGATATGSEMITELYVPRPALPAFLQTVREDFRRHRVQLIYGTVRLIERDRESFLAWARESFVCTVMNLHVEHSEAGLAKAQTDFRRLIDRAIQFGGSYFPTYHRWASRAQAERCYPQLPEFLRLKRKYDPQEVFQSDWYRHYQAMFADRL
jgi:FAD/FMN-containing dehydrogenase